MAHTHVEDEGIPDVGKQKDALQQPSFLLEIPPYLPRYLDGPPTQVYEDRYLRRAGEYGGRDRFRTQPTGPLVLYPGIVLHTLRLVEKAGDVSREGDIEFVSIFLREAVHVHAELAYDPVPFDEGALPVSLHPVGEEQI